MDYTLIICTYNPDERILLRCFAAVDALQLNALSREVIVVDNNSTQPILSNSAYALYLSKPGWRLLEVAQQGVQYARIAAIREAKGKFIVYIDADNEPQRNYLLQHQQLTKDYPEVGAWGPGRVEVDFIDGVLPHLRQYAATAFQQRGDKGATFNYSTDWQTCYPFGTGLCMPANILKRYVELADAGRFTLPGRTGHQLNSGEDTQMILLALQLGYAAGVSELLQLTHIIPASRANEQYLKRLAYGTSSCYWVCQAQVFPEKKPQIERQKLKWRRFIKQAYRRWWLARKSKDPHQLFELAAFIGNNSSNYFALGQPVPYPIKWLVRKLELG